VETLQKVTTTHRKQTAWNHSHSSETHYRNSQLPRRHRPHGCNFSVFPLINGLSYHDAQILSLTHFSILTPECFSSSFRRIDYDSISKFTDLLSYENWEDVFTDNNVNSLFNNFLNMYLKIFYACFPIRKKNEQKVIKPWLTTGIRTSCEKK
jgi:hypothetical protein